MFEDAGDDDGAQMEEPAEHVTRDSHAADGPGEEGHAEKARADRVQEPQDGVNGQHARPVRVEVRSLDPASVVCGNVAIVITLVFSHIASRMF